MLFQICFALSHVCVICGSCNNFTGSEAICNHKKNIYILRKPFCLYCFSSVFSVFAYFIAADDEKLSPPRFTPKKSARNFLSICLFLILNPRAMRVHARCSSAGGFANPPDASRQYCHVPAVSLLSGYFRGKKKKQLFHIWKFGFNETQPWWFIRGS